MVSDVATRFFIDALRGLASLFFPDICPYCQGDPECVMVDGKICDQWWSELPSIRFISGVPIYSVVPYDDRAMSVVVAAKERGERRARGLVVRAIASVLARLHQDQGLRKFPILLVPIPASRSAIKDRGEDFILRISTAAISDSDVNIAPILRWRRDVEDQSELSMRERRINLEQACEVDERLVAALLSRSRTLDSIPLHSTPLLIVIIDDVVTSGATMAAAISAISHSSLGSRSSLIGITACHSARPL